MRKDLAALADAAADENVQPAAAHRAPQRRRGTWPGPMQPTVTVVTRA
ncbi:hypothetical protein ACGFY3_01645 [Streptomyces mirabilis]